jgi:hypothetical protein
MKRTELSDCIYAIADEFSLAEDGDHVPTDEKHHARLMMKHNVCSCQTTGRSTYLRLQALGIIKEDTDKAGRTVAYYDMAKVFEANRRRADALAFRDNVLGGDGVRINKQTNKNKHTHKRASPRTPAVTLTVSEEEDSE